jgi:hypothetical protein
MLYPTRLSEIRYRLQKEKTTPRYLREKEKVIM